MRRGVGASLAAVAAVVALVGCQKVTKAVATSVSPCFRILPQARAAVDAQGTLVDVARLRGGQVTAFAEEIRALGVERPEVLAPSGGAGGAGPGGGGQPEVPPAATAPVEGRRDVCVVVFKGTFAAERIPLLVGPRQGRYAMVIVGVLAQRVRAVALTDTLPPPLHAH